jgi:small nuclear ribonucleoprotein (snRNP)-like protein
MERQHTENLFRRFKGKRVSIKTISGDVFEGTVSEITNDYISLIDTEAGLPVFLFYAAMELLMASG